MIASVAQPIRIIRSSLFSSTGQLLFGFSTRIGGVSPPPFGMNLSFSVGDDRESVAKNRDLFFGHLRIETDTVAVPQQVHGSTVLRIETPGTYPACDALITNRPGIFLCVSVADCTPIFLFDSITHAVAAIHAGWRGTSAQITSKTISKMVREFDTRPEDIIAFVGPCASVCCYAVGDDVSSRFDQPFVVVKGSTPFVDLKLANTQQLVEAGVPLSQIEISPHCTISDSLLFHSFRRDKERSGRMMGVIGTRLPRSFH